MPKFPPPRLKSIVFPFFWGEAPPDLYVPRKTGWNVDGSLSMSAIAMGQLPPEVKQVVRVRIWAVSNVAMAGRMRSEIYVYAAAENENWWNHQRHEPSKESETSNFSANDIIYWLVDASPIGLMKAGDSIFVEVYYDTNTDAVFRTVEFEYIPEPSP